MPNARTTILVDTDLLDRLERHARRRRVTKTSVIAAALESWLDAHEEAPRFSFLAVGRSGHGRLSLDGRSIMRREAGSRPEPGRLTSGRRSAATAGGPAPEGAASPGPSGSRHPGLGPADRDGHTGRSPSTRRPG